MPNKALAVIPGIANVVGAIGSGAAGAVQGMVKAADSKNLGAAASAVTKAISAPVNSVLSVLGKLPGPLGAVANAAGIVTKGLTLMAGAVIAVIASLNDFKATREAVGDPSGGSTAMLAQLGISLDKMDQLTTALHEKVTYDPMAIAFGSKMDVRTLPRPFDQTDEASLLLKVLQKLREQGKTEGQAAQVASARVLFGGQAGSALRMVNVSEDVWKRRIENSNRMRREFERKSDGGFKVEDDIRNMQANAEQVGQSIKNLFMVVFGPSTGEISRGMATISDSISQFADKLESSGLPAKIKKFFGAVADTASQVFKDPAFDKDRVKLAKEGKLNDFRGPEGFNIRAKAQNETSALLQKSGGYSKAEADKIAGYIANEKYYAVYGDADPRAEGQAVLNSNYATEALRKKEGDRAVAVHDKLRSQMKFDYSGLHAGMPGIRKGTDVDSSELERALTNLEESIKANTSSVQENTRSLKEGMSGGGERARSALGGSWRSRFVEDALRTDTIRMGAF